MNKGFRNQLKKLKGSQRDSTEGWELTLHVDGLSSIFGTSYSICIYIYMYIYMYIDEYVCIDIRGNVSFPKSYGLKILGQDKRICGSPGNERSFPNLSLKNNLALTI